MTQKYNEEQLKALKNDDLRAICNQIGAKALARDTQAILIDKILAVQATPIDIDGDGKTDAHVIPTEKTPEAPAAEDVPSAEETEEPQEDADDTDVVDTPEDEAETELPDSGQVPVDQTEEEPAPAPTEKAVTEEIQCNGRILEITDKTVRAIAVSLANAEVGDDVGGYTFVPSGKVHNMLHLVEPQGATMKLRNGEGAKFRLVLQK